ncbi:CopG family transcriptional regulator [Gloeocapsa sp. BRSZ]
MAQERHRLGLRLSPDLQSRLDELKQTTGKSYNQLIDEALRGTYLVGVKPQADPVMDRLQALEQQVKQLTPAPESTTKELPPESTTEPEKQNWIAIYN